MYWLHIDFMSFLHVVAVPSWSNTFRNCTLETDSKLLSLLWQLEKSEFIFHSALLIVNVVIAFISAEACKQQGLFLSSFVVWSRCWFFFFCLLVSYVSLTISPPGLCHVTVLWVNWYDLWTMEAVWNVTHQREKGLSLKQTKHCL